MVRRFFMIESLIAGSALLLPPGFSLAAGAASAGTTGTEEESGFTLRSDVRLVLLDVSVKDRRGQFVPELSKNDFTVLEGGKPQTITVFAHDDSPFTVGIIIDESFSMRPKRSEVLAAAARFIDESNPQDEMFVLNFNDRVTRALPPQMLFSSDIEQLRKALRSNLPDGKTALNDAVIAGLKQLQQGRREKKALLLISDGGDNISSHSRREMLDMVESSAATVYTIGIYDEGNPDIDPGVLRQISAISGGEAYFPDSLSEMGVICHHIADDLRRRYTIGYVPQSGDGALRRLHVRVSPPDHDKLIVLARSSYRYDDLPNQSQK